MSKKDYIPSNDLELVAWGGNAYSYADANCKRWGVIAPDNDAKKRMAEYKSLVEICRQPAYRNVDVRQKNESKKEVIKDLRTYIQGYVSKNPLVTNNDRDMMQLPIRDAVPTPVGDPVGLVTATIKYPNDGALELNIMHVDGTPFDKRANYGVKIRSVVLSIDQPSPNEVIMLPESRFTRRKKELFKFDEHDRKKIAYFCMRYENSKGTAGQWSSIISAVIP